MVEEEDEEETRNSTRKTFQTTAATMSSQNAYGGGSTGDEPTPGTNLSSQEVPEVISTAHVAPMATATCVRRSNRPPLLSLTRGAKIHEAVRQHVMTSL